MLEHPFEPVFNADSTLLILGTFPSVKSREDHFYYAHPRNRFWPLMAALFNEPLPHDTLEKKTLLLKHRIAVWDVVQRCEIVGSSDAHITQACGVDLLPLLKQSRIQKIYANGAKACQLYQKLCEAKTGRAITSLPSTSPANAAYSFERLLDAWSILRD